MPRRARQAKRRRDQLTFRQEFELIVGPTHLRAIDANNGKVHERSAFTSDDERKAAWFHHRDRLLATPFQPWGWCRYELQNPIERTDAA